MYAPISHDMLVVLSSVSAAEFTAGQITKKQKSQKENNTNAYTCVHKNNKVSRGTGRRRR